MRAGWGAALPALLSAMACSKQHCWLGDGALPPALWWRSLMAGIGERCLEISGACKCVGEAAHKNKLGACQLQELGWGV